MTMVKQKGLSLVETMIALTLGAIVTVGIIQLFVANSETYNLLQGQSRMQESARFALNFLGRDVQSAGYKGCFSRNEEVYSVAENPDGIPYEFDVRQALIAYNGGATDWNPNVDDNGLTTLPDSENADSFSSDAADSVPIDELILGTDILTIRHTSSTEAPLSAGLPTSTEDVVVDTPADPPGIEFVAGDLILIHDCEKSTIFRATSVNTNTGTGETTIGHTITGAQPFDNALEQLAEVNTYLEDAAVSAIVTNIYFIAPGAGINNQGESPLSLWRKSGKGPPVELVEGVEDLQILFGQDTDGDGVPNAYESPVSGMDYREIVTVRVSITVNSIDDVGGTSEPTHGCIWDGGEQPCIDGEPRDGLIRRTFHQTVQLRNRG